MVRKKRSLGAEKYLDNVRKTSRAQAKLLDDMVSGYEKRGILVVCPDEECPAGAVQLRSYGESGPVNEE